LVREVNVQPRTPTAWTFIARNLLQH